MDMAMDTGGYLLEFETTDDAERAEEVAVRVAQERADCLGVWGRDPRYGTWATGLRRMGCTLFVDGGTPVYQIAYDIAGTPHTETLFQRICMTIAFSYPGMPFTGTSTYRTGGEAIGSRGTHAHEVSVVQTMTVDYDGERLCFDVTTEVRTERGCDVTEQHQRWEHNDWGFFVRRSSLTTYASAGADPIDLELLASSQPENPYQSNTAFFRDLQDTMHLTELPCGGVTPDGCTFGCTVAEVDGHAPVPAVCLADARGREVLVACTGQGTDGDEGLPRWVQASPDAELLVWQMADTTYLWDGLRVRRVV